MKLATMIFLQARPKLSNSTRRGLKAGAAMAGAWGLVHRMLMGRSKSRLKSLAISALGCLQLSFAAHMFVNYIGYPKLTAGPSMLPTLNAKGDAIWVNRHYRRGRDVQVGDVVSFKHPTFTNQSASKRVLGMPGDYVMRDSPESGSDEMVQVPNGHFWASGDNSPWSRDSREWGPLPLALILGKVTWRIWPLGQVGRLENGMVGVRGDKGFLKNG